MARLTMIPPRPDDPALKPVLEKLIALRGPDFELPNLYRTLGISPPMLRAWIDFAWPLRLHASSSRKTRELMILRGAQVSGTDYEWAHHVSLALEIGVTQQQIDALSEWRESPIFTAQEKAAIRLAEEVTEGPGASAECIEALKKQFGDAEVVELVLTACFYVCVGRFLTSMDVELEPDHEHLRPANPS
ncbi:MAG: carboxymuconolactone decarboxylase family protein [Burkholderiaceae bacterium]